MVKIGINTSCSQKHNRPGIRDILAFVFDNSFQVVEFRDEYPFAEDLTGEDIEWARVQMEERGIWCSVHLPFYNLDLSAFRNDLRMAAVNSVVRSVEVAAKLGARTATVHGGSMKRSYYSAEWKKTAEELSLDSLARINRECKERGIKLLIENLNLFSDRVHRVHALPAQLLETKAELGDNIGFTLDIAHAVSTPLNPVEYALALGPENIKLAHLNDNDLQSDQHLGLGLGRIDYRSFMEAYLEKKWGFPLLFETQSEEYALTSKAYLEKLIKEIKG